MILPSDATPGVIAALRDLDARIAAIASAGNIDLKGRRIINAGQSEGNADYVTRAELARKATEAQSENLNPTLSGLTVRGVLRVLGSLFMNGIPDAAIVFTRTGGQLDGDDVMLSWRYTNNSLRLGAPVVVRWHHGVELRGDGTVLTLQGEDSNATPFTLLVLGAATSATPGLKRSGAELQARAGDDSAYVDFRCKNLTADNVAPAGGDPTFGTVTADQFIATTRPGYTIANAVSDRDYDANATDVNELADVLASLIGDLQNVGILS